MDCRFVTNVIKVPLLLFSPLYITHSTKAMEKYVYVDFSGINKVSFILINFDKTQSLENVNPEKFSLNIFCEEHSCIA